MKALSLWQPWATLMVWTPPGLAGPVRALARLAAAASFGSSTLIAPASASTTA